MKLKLPINNEVKIKDQVKLNIQYCTYTLKLKNKIK